MKLKKLSAIVISLIMAFCFISCNEHEDETHKNQTYLTVYNYDGGIGTDWLYSIAEKFEQKYANESFEPGKKGVYVQISKGKDTLSTIASSNYNVVFSEQVLYNDLISQNLLLDISDIVKEKSLSEITDGAESGTIESKMDESQKKALTALNDKYYVIPHYEVYTGLTYDVDLFEGYELFFKDGGGWTSEDSEKSVGPDGIRSSYDDGLPSSYEEFYLLINRMVNNSITPFIWTGQYTNYINDLLSGLWVAYSGKDEFMLNFTFDSQGSETNANIINSFNDNLPNIENIEITNSNGYLMSRQAGKYYAFDFLQKILSNSSYYSNKITDVLTHLDAQTEYIYSNLENNPIAMIIEGNYWYNEASDSFRRSENTYKDKAKDRNFAWMPLPRKVAGSVTENNGEKNTLLDTLTSFAFINSNIKDNQVKVDLAKLFLQYCYTNEALIDFTFTTGCSKALSYEMPSEKLNSMKKYFKRLYEIKQNSDVVYPYSDNPIFIKSQSNFRFDLGSTIWKSTVSNTPYVNAYTAIKKGISAKDYFIGSWTTVDFWNNNYAEYF